VVQVRQAASSVPGRRRVLQLAGRLGWGVADQAVSSLGNFALGLYVLQAFGAVQFGAFSLAFVTYTVVLNAARGLATDPMLVRCSGQANLRWHRASSAASGTALAVGITVGLVCAAAGLLLPEPVGSAFVALGVGLPGLMFQDSWRFVFFACHRSAQSLLNDLIWGALLVGVLVVLHRTGQASQFRCLLAFGLTASLSGVVGSVQALVLPRPDRTLAWFREHRDLSIRYLVENVSASGGPQVRSMFLGALAGLAQVGYVRGAEMLMGPFVVVLMGVAQVAVPEAARVFRHKPQRLSRFCLALGGAQAAAASLWGLILAVVLPLGAGSVMLKESRGPVTQMLPAVTLAVVAACFAASLLTGLRAMGAAERSLRAQLTSTAVYIVCSVVGVLLGGGLGACWGATVGMTISAMTWWYQLRTALEGHRRAVNAHV
jgi:O-antigen/teichoic acid export membrane protein